MIALMELTFGYNMNVANNMLANIVHVIHNLLIGKYFSSGFFHPV